ncbi:MAG: ATP-binding protein [Bacteroidales bacterium]|nr:ATP-binding protein [Bacteroidales bacterium]
MKLLRRKVDLMLKNWKQNPDKKPLIVKGARQIGKTESITAFAKSNYKSAVVINFALQIEYRDIFNDGYSVDKIVKNISLLNSDLKFPENDTLIFFDEMQECSACATSLKAFKIDGRYDVICSGSLMGINYNEIESNSVGYKEEYEMHSMDFEEFLWANGHSDSQIEDLFQKMKSLTPLSDIEMKVFGGHFYDYIITGGMPAVVSEFVTNKNFSGILKLQQGLLLDYQEDITKYAIGLDKGKVRNAYNHIAVFLAKENKKFQITKVSRNARSRDYIGVVDWLHDAGIINVCYCLDTLSLPLKVNYNPSVYKIYFKDTGLLTASLDKESQYDLRANRNFNTYKGAIFENIVGDMLVKQGYDLYYYKNEKSTIEMDFFIRNTSSLIPIEVKAADNSTKSLNKLTDPDKYPEIKFGIKLCNKNIGFNGKFYTFPYFLTFLLRRYLEERG